MAPTTRATPPKAVPTILIAFSCAAGMKSRTIAPTTGRNVARLTPQSSNHSTKVEPPLGKCEQSHEHGNGRKEHRRVSLDLTGLYVPQQASGPACDARSPVHHEVHDILIDRVVGMSSRDDSPPRSSVDDAAEVDVVEVVLVLDEAVRPGERTGKDVVAEALPVEEQIPDVDPGSRNQQ